MNKMICPFCERRCELGPETLGFCRMYHFVDDQVVERYPHRYSSLGISHIEAIPFYHFQPGSRTMILGTAGCNFDCKYCSNAYVARSEPEPLLYFELTPERVIALANQEGCHNIAFAINEPTVSYPSLRELAYKAKEAGLPVGILTNGYMQPEIAEDMAQTFDFINVSLKSMQDSFYRQYVGVPSAAIVMRNIERLHGKTHMELSTPIVQGLNDQEIPAMTDFIAGIDSQIPWHVFRLLPEYKMAEYERPSIDEVNAALELSRQHLEYVYFGNFVGSHWVSTLCPQCGTPVIERINMGGCGAKSLTYRLDNGHCTSCDLPIPIVGNPIDWNSKEMTL